MNKTEEGSQAKDKVQVQIVTTSGNYPEEGYRDYPASEPLQAVLQQAGAHLKLHNTEQWLAKIDGRQLDKARSLAENSITGQVLIMWGQDDSGGGNGDDASGC